MGKYSKFILAIVLVGARLLTLPCDTRVGAVTIAFSGFEENSLHLVSNSSLIFNSTTGCFKYDPRAVTNKRSPVAGRLLYPLAVQMRDPGSTTVKSFSTAFIYQFQIVPEYGYHTGPGMAFCVVPDDTTLGAPGDFMGLISKETSETAKNYESDNHTLGVELDLSMNREFNDTNSNHIGIDLASMTSVYSFKPVLILASTSAGLYQQIWIDYIEADSRMDIYYANYKEGKPAEPQGSQSGLDLSLLKDNMYIGFSSANKIGSGTVPYICAWSFSNDGIPAPPIVLAQDATPDGPVAAPSLPPPASTPSPPPATIPSPPLATIPIPPPVTTRSPPPAPSSAPPSSRSNPSPLSPLNPPTPSSVPPPGPSSEPPTTAKKGGKEKNLTGVYVGVCVGVPVFLILVGLCLFVLCRFWSRPLRVFISHAGGQDGIDKIFAIDLHDRMKKYRWSFSTLSNIKFFFDKDDIRPGENISERILQELARFNVGVVVVTEAFFKGKWPMKELIAFVEAQRNDPTDRIRLLPLFYGLKPEDVRERLNDETWVPNWEAMSRGSGHLDVDKCRDAVDSLCRPLGIRYCYNKLDRVKEYIEEVCQALNGILRKERSILGGR